MIKKLLSIIKEGKVHSIREMAQTLNVSQNLVEQMISDLVRKGYLKEQPQECSQLCGDCSLINSACIMMTNPQPLPFGY